MQRKIGSPVPMDCASSSFASSTENTLSVRNRCEHDTLCRIQERSPSQGRFGSTIDNPTRATKPERSGTEIARTVVVTKKKGNKNKTTSISGFTRCTRSKESQELFALCIRGELNATLHGRTRARGGVRGSYAPRGGEVAKIN